MPDCHAGKGCVIGTVMTLNNGKVVPNITGVDLSCGMHVVELGKVDLDLNKLDRLIKRDVPRGFSARSEAHRFVKELRMESTLNNIRAEIYNMPRNLLSVGTLGSGNHFIEVDKDDEGNLYLVIHTGSRNLGKQIAEYWQKIAVETCEEETPADLAYLSGELFDGYMADTEIANEYADASRRAIANVIIEGMDLEVLSSFTTVHNYIDLKNKVLRKGAVSAKEGEVLIIPINMRDGSLIAVGKGNEDWNTSAPHGAGRIMSRGQAKREIDLDRFKTSMDGIFSTTVNENTLDESPEAYKGMEEIIANTGDTVEVLKVIKPIYNIKDDTGRRKKFKKTQG